MTAEVTKRGSLDMQVCVPADWTEEQVKRFADSRVMCGTARGWQIRKQGNDRLAGCDERVSCAQRSGRVHIMLEA